MRLRGARLGLSALIALCALTELSWAQEAEEAVRKADAAWEAAASTGNADAWMAFYAPDALVLLPSERLLSGAGPVRSAVVRLLGRKRLLVDWHPVALEGSSAADLAYVSAKYELHFADEEGAARRDRGRRLEIWRRQVDGTWRCIVDTWVSDELPSAPAAPARSSTVASPTPGAGPSSTAQAQDAKYGAKPVNYEVAVREYFASHLSDPESIDYREISAPAQGYLTGVSGTVLMSETRTYGWLVKATVIVKGSRGRASAPQTYTFLFRGEDIASSRPPPLPGEIR